MIPRSLAVLCFVMFCWPIVKDVVDVEFVMHKCVHFSEASLSCLFVVKGVMLSSVSCNAVELVE